MLVALLVVLVFAYVVILWLYRLVGKRQIFKLDLVQFVYAFVMLPILFIWLKSFLYFFLKQELGSGLSVGQLFTIDTILSTVFLYIFAFVVMHSLTKTFNLRHFRDPLYDVFEHSEYFHLIVTHIGIYFGAMLLISVLSIANVFVPVALVLPKVWFWAYLGFSFMVGILVFVGIWLSDPKQGRFMRHMKLTFAFFFLIHAVVYFAFDPSFNASRLIYRGVANVFAATVASSFFFQRSRRAITWADRLKHGLWDKKLFVFERD